MASSKSFLFFSLFHALMAQELHCASIADGCRAGVTHDSAIKSALARFSIDQTYGGGKDPIVFSSFLNGDSLAQIAYSCRDGAIPPSINGSTAQNQYVSQLFKPELGKKTYTSIFRSRIEFVLSCPNQCGSVSLATNAECGFGVLVAEGATDPCFSKAINVIPSGTPVPTPSSSTSPTSTATASPTVLAGVGSFQNAGCFEDSTTARVLIAQAFRDPSPTGMTVEKCVAFARSSSWRYAGVEFGRYL